MRTGSGAGSDVDMADMVLNAEVNCPPRMLVGGSSAGLCSKVIVSSAACQHVAICTALKGQHVQCQVVACTTHIYCEYKKLVGISKHVCRYGSNCSRQRFTVVCSRKLDRSPSLVLTASSFSGMNEWAGTVSKQTRHSTFAQNFITRKRIFTAR